MAVTRREIRLRNCSESMIMGYTGEPAILRHAQAAVSDFSTLKRALKLERHDLCRTLSESGLTEPGKPCCVGDIWREASSQRAGMVLCNAAALEPGSFRERVLLETAPFRLIEAIAVAGYATGAGEGTIFLQREAGLAEVLESAVEEAKREGFLGRNIQGSGFGFNISIFPAAGGYVCREESALLRLMQGERAEPIPEDLSARTVVHGIEALFRAAEILDEGASARLFSISGDVPYPGLYEAPAGSTLRELIFSFAGGITGGRFKAALVGGSGGICAGAPDIDRRLEPDDLPPGSGVITVLNESRCMVDVACGIAAFFKNESCGLCTPCRVGTKRLHEILSWWSSGAGDAADLKLVQNLGEVMEETCGEHLPNKPSPLCR